ncbi:very short patch repair endonuclease [Pseudarthrobacter phenanthrenivorans]|uniref:very short patch repair endonuclease n=1 Tax=Pseudarthrobacter phenanthrenivorans TaxID=361575 RepID=UPI002F3505EF
MPDTSSVDQRPADMPSADRLTPEQRSWNMSRIRGKNTKPELLVRRLLHAKGYRYRLHGRSGGAKLPGNPDLVFAGRRKVIFVNGCFWHFHDCRVGLHAPKANADFWAAKRTRTRERDAAQRRELQDAGWEVLTIWECELKNHSALETQLVHFLEAGGRQTRKS